MTQIYWIWSNGGGFAATAICLLVSLLLAQSCPETSAADSPPELPSLYEHYTAGGVHSGLVANASQFTLNGRPIVLFSGTFHYFRVLPDRWRSTLRKMRAAGLNAVQTYVAWNVHEDRPGVLDFESPDRNLTAFLAEVRAADMLAIVRPGPFICAEWEFGGLPSWLLRDHSMAVRTNHPGYRGHVTRYWNRVMAILNQQRFSINNGPVVMVQLENEYGGWVHAPTDPKSDPGLQHLQFLHNLTRASGYQDLLFTCDNTGTIDKDPVKTMPDVLEVVNGNAGMHGAISRMRTRYPNRPAYVSEFWNGWFDGWKETGHHRMSTEAFEKEAETVLFTVNGSINFFPFIGGTNFGFMNGGYVHQGGFPNIRVGTSYDFDAPLTEGGQYTDKYRVVRKLYEKLVETGRLPRLRIAEKFPDLEPVQGYGSIRLTRRYLLETLLKHATVFANMSEPVSMEMLDVGEGVGQRYGFVLYRVASEKMIENYEVTGPIMDRATLLVDGHQSLTVLDPPNLSVSLEPSWFQNRTTHHHLDLLVENMGRPCDSDPKVMAANTRKGIISGGHIRLDGKPPSGLSIYSLDFNRTFIEAVTTDSSASVSTDIASTDTSPALFVGDLVVNGVPADTYVRLADGGWTKGMVFVNGFNLGRHWSVGPGRTLYLPAPLLRTGTNQIAVFELHPHHQDSKNITTDHQHQVAFVDQPVLG